MKIIISFIIKVISNVPQIKDVILLNKKIKNKVMNKKLMSLLLLLNFVFYSCHKEVIITNDLSIEGSYNAIINPILCSLPTMSDLVIKNDGTSYTMTFTHSSAASSESIHNVKITQSDTITTLNLDGSKLGDYLRMKYVDFSNGEFQTIENKVLLIQFNKDNKHYEFMGKK